MKYNVINPDGFPIRPKPFNSRERAEAGLAKFCKQPLFKIQGYYSAADGRHISLDQLPAACKVEEAI